MAVAEISNLVIPKGTDFSATFNIFKDDRSKLELSGATAVAKIRKYPTSPTYTTFLISINILDGSLTISLNPNETSGLTAGRNFFDILVTKNEKTFPVLRGTILVEESVSL